MAKPYTHAISSAKRYGGVPEDYLAIHDFMDGSKGACADNRHRALTHNSWFLSEVLERVFGHVLTNSAGRVVSVRQIGEDHVLEDFGMKFIPTAMDYLSNMAATPWMQNGINGIPPSAVLSRPTPYQMQRGDNLPLELGELLRIWWRAKWLTTSQRVIGWLGRRRATTRRTA